MPPKNQHANTNPLPRGGGGGRPFRGGRGRGRGGGRGRGRGGGGGGGGSSAQAHLASELDMMNDFIIAPPSPEPRGSGSPFRGNRGRGRGGAGAGAGGRGRGRGGFVRDDDFHQGNEGFRGRGRGRGGYGGRGRGGSSMLQDDLQVMGRQFAAEEQANQQGDYASVLFPSRGGAGRGGGRGGKAPRGRGGPPSNDIPPRRRSSGIGAADSPQASRGNHNSNYRPVDPFGPLSSLLYRERPLLRPIIFVPSVHTRILFSCDDEEEARQAEMEVKEEVVHVDNVDALDEGVQLGEGGQPREDFSAHAPTADRVMRVFMGSPINSSSSDSSSNEDDDGLEGGEDDDMETIEEIDFSDLSKLMEPSPRKKKSKKTQVDTTKLWMEQGTGEESFLGLKATSSAEVSAEDPEQERIVGRVDDMHIGEQAGSGEAGDAAALIERAVVEVAPAATEAIVSDVPAAVHETEEAAGVQPTAQQPKASADQQQEGERTLHFVIDTEPSFMIDTEPVHVHAHEKPRIRTPPPIRMYDDDDDEVIVYVAPHPRRAEVEEAERAQEAKLKEAGQHTFTPYEGIRGTTSSSAQATASNSVPAAFPALGTPRLPKRLAAPPLSTPRMAKQAQAKQKRVAKREKDADRRRKARPSQGLFDKKRKGRGSFGAMGARMQERELRDEYGSGSEDDGVDKKKRERRRGDSDLEWGTDDEDEDGQRKVAGKKRGEDEDEYMTVAELQRVLMESSTAGKVKGGDDGEAGFVPFTPTAASKRRERRRKVAANANAGAAAQRRKDDYIAAALEMDVDLDLDPDAMKRFVGGMLGKNAGVHVSAGDLEDEDRMRDEDEDAGGGMGESGDSESEDEDEDEEEKELQKVIDVEEELMIAEDLMAEMSVEDDEDDDEDEDDEDEERTPRAKFTAKLEKIRESSRKPKATAKAKGKGKGKEDSDDDDFDDDMDFEDDEEDEFFNKHMKYAAEDEEENLIEAIQDLLDQDEDPRSKNRLFKAISNGEFEYLEDDFSFPTAKRGKKAKRDLIPPELRAQWDKDREAKAERKQQRELDKLLRAGDPFAPKKGGKKGRKAMLAAARLDPTITVISNRIIDMSTLVQMLHKFVDDLGGKQTLSLPPTNKETRKNVHQLALAFNLKSVSKGKGDARYVTVSKTTRTAPGRFDDRKVARIMKKCGGPGARSNEFMSGANGYKGPGGVPKHKEGTIVGEAAPKIGATNVGFKMLAMMGWSEGERIGVGGLDAPIEAVIKHSKLGLGATK